MNTALANISDSLGSIAFGMGALVVYTTWRRKNPCYQTRNIIGSISVWFTGAALIRPSGLLITTIVGRMIEITGSTIGWLYLSGKLEFQGLVGLFLSSQEMAQPEIMAGDMPPSFWQKSHHDESVKAIRENIKAEYLNPLD